MRNVCFYAFVCSTQRGMIEANQLEGFMSLNAHDIIPPAPSVFEQFARKFQPWVYAFLVLVHPQVSTCPFCFGLFDPLLETNATTTTKKKRKPPRLNIPLDPGRFISALGRRIAARHQQDRLYQDEDVDEDEEELGYFRPEYTPSQFSQLFNDDRLMRNWRDFNRLSSHAQQNVLARSSSRSQHSRRTKVPTPYTEATARFARMNNKAKTAIRKNRQPWAAVADLEATLLSALPAGIVNVEVPAWFQLGDLSLTSVDAATESTVSREVESASRTPTQDHAPPRAQASDQGDSTCKDLETVVHAIRQLSLDPLIVFGSGEITPSSTLLSPTSGELLALPLFPSKFVDTSVLAITELDSCARLILHGLCQYHGLTSTTVCVNGQKHVHIDIPDASSSLSMRRCKSLTEYLVNQRTRHNQTLTSRSV
eukprot:m.129172 g.129172  ORF g.129172 m.129172 type:complete len:424 (-) comp15691_c3_seq4:32-1303(-)